jgi:Tfp pilus assembly protein PilX
MNWGGYFRVQGANLLILLVILAVLAIIYVASGQSL